MKNYEKLLISSAISYAIKPPLTFRDLPQAVRHDICKLFNEDEPGMAATYLAKEIFSKKHIFAQHVKLGEIAEDAFQEIFDEIICERYLTELKKHTFKKIITKIFNTFKKIITKIFNTFKKIITKIFKFSKFRGQS